MELLSIKFNPFDVEVIGFNPKDKTLRIRICNGSVFLTYKVDELKMLTIMRCEELDFDEICQLLQSRIRGKMYLEELSAKIYTEKEVR